MCEMIAKFGIGQRPTNYHEIRIKFVNKKLNYLPTLLSYLREQKKKCTTVLDEWSDSKKRHIHIHRPKGSFFQSINKSDRQPIKSFKGCQ